MDDLVIFTFCDENWRISEGWDNIWELIDSQDFSELVKILKDCFGEETVWCPAHMTSKFREAGLEVKRYDSRPISGIVILNNDDFITMIHKNNLSKVILCKTVDFIKTEKVFKYSGIKPLNIIPKLGLQLERAIVEDLSEFKLFLQIWNQHGS